ncbi:hypothetical protein FSARC_10743 [Fusarium sarcochroum]|uniref:Uncharacterized protein n=1 Tax=Fusarium sarcochroum TaxID=1208366 RepID=A0A8H4X2A6_9HYPO|nr:hypothetical protein FSARC_10743 [Fusarium sarcochroum]
MPPKNRSILAATPPDGRFGDNNENPPSPTLSSKDDDKLSNTEIVEILKLGNNNRTIYSVVAKASRTVHEYTGQWPWEWAADFPPQRWSKNMVQELAKLIRGLEGNTHKLEEVKKYFRDIIEEKKKRKSYSQNLKYGDIENALERFGLQKPGHYRERMYAWRTKALDTQHDDSDEEDEDYEKENEDNNENDKDGETPNSGKDEFGDSSTIVAAISPAPITNSKRRSDLPCDPPQSSKRPRRESRGALSSQQDTSLLEAARQRPEPFIHRESVAALKPMEEIRKTILELLKEEQASFQTVIGPMTTQIFKLKGPIESQENAQAQVNNYQRVVAEAYQDRESAEKSRREFESHKEKFDLPPHIHEMSLNHYKEKLAVCDNKLQEANTELSRAKWALADMNSDGTLQKLDQMRTELAELQGRHDQTIGDRKSWLGEVLRLASRSTNAGDDSSAASSKDVAEPGSVRLPGAREG